MNGAAPPAVSLVGLRRMFGEFAAVRDISLDIGDREFFSLIGPSGCGKTTTLRLIAGLDVPSAGRVLVHGRDVTSVPAHRRPVNTVFQQFALFPHLDVFENVAFGLRERRVGKSELRSRVAEMLDLVGLSGRERSRPRELSGGQQQRVALARSLVLRPEVLLLDEPLGALDLKLRRQMQQLLKNIQREVGITFVYVTHDQEEAFSMSDRVGIVNAGLLDQVGLPKEVYHRPQTLFVADFVGASNRFPGTVLGVLGSGIRYRAELGSLGVVEASGVDGLEPGAAVIAIVRPEAVTVAAAGGDDLSVDGVITDVSYLGPQVQCSLRSDRVGTVVAVARSLGDAYVARTGQRLTFRLSSDAMWLVPAEPVAT